MKKALKLAGRLAVNVIVAYAVGAAYEQGLKKGKEAEGWSPEKMRDAMGNGLMRSMVIAEGLGLLKPEPQDTYQGA